jgi:hypothetical protein
MAVFAARIELALVTAPADAAAAAVEGVDCTQHVAVEYVVVHT